MKTIKIPTLFVAIIGMLVALPSGAEAQNVGEMYKQARTAFSNGDLESAAALLDQIVAAQPSYVPARALRAQVQERLAARGGGDALKKKCEAVVIPKIDFADVELKLALEALAIAASDATGKKFRPNFILGGGEEVASRRVSLQLRGAPLSTILEYMGKVTNVNFRYERFAIVGTAQGAAGATTAPAPESTVPAAAPEDPFGKR